MYLYPKIKDESILLHNDCKRLLRRNSRRYIIQEVLDRINQEENNSAKQEFNNNSNNINKFDIYTFILDIFGCNKNI